MVQISASKFKEQCLSLLESVGPDGIVITKHGKPVARLLPFDTDCRALIGAMRGKIKIRGNIMTTGLKWNAQS